MHYLQKNILDALRYNPPATYTALMPGDIESSHFRYHLKQLMTDGLVQKNADGLYALTDKGQREVDYLSENRTTTLRTPKVITYTLLTHDDSLLLLEKPKEPYRGLLGLIGGKVNFGEDMQAAAKREVYEKTRLVIPPPNFRGVANIQIKKDDDAGEPLSHVIAYVHSYEIDGLADPLPPGLIQATRSDIEEHAAIPDLLPLLQLLDSETQPFARDLHCQLST